MADTPTPARLPDAPARLAALTDHGRTLLVEAGAGSGKTALMAGRVSLLIGAGVHPKEIVAITFTEAAASELLERIERFVQLLLGGEVPVELREALPRGLSASQRENLESGARALDEITCTTIHGFCQQLVKPYPVETGIDPGAAIIDPAAAQIVYQDLMEAWLSARFGRDRGAEGLGRIPAIADAGGEENFFTELLMKAPDETLELISKTAQFLKLHRTAHAPPATVDASTFTRLAEVLTECAAWYNGCGVAEPTTGDLIEDLTRVATLAREAAAGPLTGRRIAELLFHTPPIACKKDETAFKQWGRKGKWKEAAKNAGRSAAHGDQLSATGETFYQACGAAYQDFCADLGALAFQRFVVEFDALKDLYRDYKRKAALLDFDDLLHHARDLLKCNEPVRQALARRFPHILVDEFQDTDPLQTEIMWRLAGDGDSALPWLERAIRPGALFLVADPKQAIYRFRGADVDTYIAAKQVLAARYPGTTLEITANFRSQAPILEFINSQFASMLDGSQSQPGFAALTPVRARGTESSVAAFEVVIDSPQRNSRGDLIVDLVRQQEAGIVAAILGRLIGAYPVWDNDSQRFRPARAGDIALLAPTGTSLWIYERALEAREIPIATQAGKGFFRRQEVQDLIAVARAVADRRDTFALGALLRGPLVGLTEEEISDEIGSLQNAAGTTERLNLWTDPTRINNPVLKQTMLVLQNLARKARRTTPYQLLAEAVEELQVRPILSARHPRGAERALANVELVLQMARAYAARGIADFARALWERWADQDAQTEGRPDAEANAVSIITIHSAKGLEWPIVIPINSTTSLWSDSSFLYRRLDDTVHFRVFDFPSRDYDAVAQTEKEARRRERVRLWYVALTRARDLLLLPRQTERIPNDWLSLVTLDINALPILDLTNFNGSAAVSGESAVNVQDLATWEREAAVIAASERAIVWHQPSRHEGPHNPPEISEEIFVGPEAPLERLPRADDEIKAIQGGRERGVILHKLLEEVLTRETDEDVAALQARASELLAQLGLADNEDSAVGLSSSEMASTVHRALQLPDVAALRPRLLPEFRVYAGVQAGQEISLTAGIADAVASDETGRVKAVIDWKSDVDPAPDQIDIYRAQVRYYLGATGAQLGLVVFLTSCRVERVELPT
jgi:ATP-dependent exoDNAse (exonuclease V) beta subunit